MEEDAFSPDPSLFSSDEDTGIIPTEAAEEEEEEDRSCRRRHHHLRRSRCWSGCGRPITTCICPILPAPPILTSTHIIILHHPHELRANKLATIPALSRAISRCDLISGRRLRPGSSPLLDSASVSASPVLFLFPSFDPSSFPALEIGRWAAGTPAEARAEPILVVFDGTWKRAKEMAAASVPFLSRFALQVQIDGGCDASAEGESAFESELVLRKEPWKGCLSTIEAVARALRVLEPEGKGAEIEARLIAILRAMVAFQAPHLKQVEPRPRLLKKKKTKTKEDQWLGS